MAEHHRGRFSGSYAQSVLDTTKIWELENTSSHAHPIHRHLATFDVTDHGSDGTHPSAPNERSPREIVRVDTGETVRIVI